MTWFNIHIDHIIPVKAFVERSITDLRVINHYTNLRVINHYTNLQPMFGSDNIRKWCHYTEEDFLRYIEAVYAHIATKDKTKN
jgi:hypothetical protein